MASIPSLDVSSHPHENLPADDHLVETVTVVVVGGSSSEGIATRKHAAAQPKQQQEGKEQICWIASVCTDVSLICVKQLEMAAIQLNPKIELLMQRFLAETDATSHHGEHESVKSDLSAGLATVKSLRALKTFLMNTKSNGSTFSEYLECSKLCFPGFKVATTDEVWFTSTHLTFPSTPH